MTRGEIGDVYVTVNGGLCIINYLHLVPLEMSIDGIYETEEVDMRSVDLDLLEYTGFYLPNY